MAPLQMKSKSRPQEDLTEKEKSNLMMKIKATEPTEWGFYIYNNISAIV